MAILTRQPKTHRESLNVGTQTDGSPFRSNKITAVNALDSSKNTKGTHLKVPPGTSLRPLCLCDAKYCSMNTKFLATVSIAGVALLYASQAQSQPPAPGSMSRTTEQATRPEAPGGGHGQVWVNTELGVYHREGSPFYGTTQKGKYMTEQDAIHAGFKRAPKTL